MPMGRLNEGQCTPQRPPSHYCPQPAITTFQSSQTLQVFYKNKSIYLKSNTPWWEERTRISSSHVARTVKVLDAAASLPVSPTLALDLSGRKTAEVPVALETVAIRIACSLLWCKRGGFLWGTETSSQTPHFLQSSDRFSTHLDHVQSIYFGSSVREFQRKA